MFYVVLLAMVAGFLALRLYMVLGKRTGHEQPLPKAAEDRLPITTLPRPIEAAPEPRELVNRNIDPKAEAGLRAIVSAEAGFDVGQFVEGAQSAYRMILEAYWKGDEESLGWLVEDEVKQAFADAIAARRDAGHVLDNRLVSIERAIIADAALDGRNARITVRFDADIAAVTRDAEGNLVAGSMSDAVETHDVWTFARTLKSSDPNWKLADTDEA
ncbi:Tim44 domain-containing protein [Sphingomonas sp. So64.6b]|uniref:Tim44/TimA family putative adaptor protein n=1 Tax=Sphingomonas sp. So64.6b TaxID=2997354 RepID=UPI001600FC42|nr:Tim44/TimA family putative adaptor protein [Sphingomonas sp. So64.6b]QNA83273.1 Tim44 domain-containing protein [Sphingomonas sp. So64.6b]